MIEGGLKAPSGYILVKGNVYSEKYEGTNLYKYYQAGRETHDVNYHAEVVAVPDDALNDIVAEVLPGDKVWFHYNSFLNNFHNYMVMDDVWRINYFDVLAVERDGEIIPIGGWCMVEPGVDKIQAITTEIEVVSETWGILRHIGTPKKGWDINPMPKPGDKVGFDKTDSWVNKIGGKNYYCMTQDRITGIYG